jgi:hypothetical protein
VVQHDAGSPVRSFAMIFPPSSRGFPARETPVHRALESLSSVYFPRQSEIRRLETLLAEARQKLHALARQGEDDASERECVGELMKNIARLKAVSRYLR